VIGAGAIALWFLLIDTIQGTPFHTPLFVARALLGIEQPEAGVGVLIGYTVVHFAAFAMVGMITAWLLQRAGIRPYHFFGLVLGFLLFDLIFYSGVIISGTDVVQALGWPAVLAGNIIAGFGVIAWLHAKSDLPRTQLSVMLREHRVIAEGIATGAIGAVAVMAWFLVLDLAQGRVLFTPGALGSALFFGARGIGEVQVTATTVLGYTGLHLAAFLAVGLLASALIEAAGRQPPLLFGLALFFVTLETSFIGLIVILAAWLLDAIQAWTIVVANLIAAVVMGGFLLWRRPEVRETLSHDIEEELAQAKD
jgi:hypothetical protein